MELKDETRDVGRDGGGEPIETMDENDVERKHQDVFLLLGTEYEVLADNQHLQDVEAASHPTGMVCSMEPIRHLQGGRMAGKELLGKQFTLLILGRVLSFLQA